MELKKQKKNNSKERNFPSKTTVYGGQGFGRIFYKNKPLELKEPFSTTTLIIRKNQPDPNKIYLDMRYKENKKFLITSRNQRRQLES